MDESGWARHVGREEKGVAKGYGYSVGVLVFLLFVLLKINGQCTAQHFLNDNRNPSLVAICSTEKFTISSLMFVESVWFCWGGE